MNKRKVLSIGTGDFLLLIGASAIVCGIMFIIKPDGSLLGLSVDQLKNSPFNDFLIPGVILLVFNGFLSTISSFLLLINYRFAGLSVMFLGGVMILWISAQIYWMGWGSWLQPSFIAVGLIELLIGFFLEAQYHHNWKMFGRGQNTPAH
ncbi:MAG: hypothetical protein K6T88_00155 [Bacillus sp. (in: Bacteria)]|nr:hypothetical protein [Bacillus sp. (in: firmicutes)]